MPSIQEISIPVSEAQCPVCGLIEPSLSLVFQSVIPPQKEIVWLMMECPKCDCKWQVKYKIGAEK